MKHYLKPVFISVLFLFSFISSQAQAPAFNQNSARSNNRSHNASSDTWSFGINSGAAFGVNSNEKTLFRGNSMATKMFGRYYFGMAGLGISSGFIPGAINDNTLGNFLTERKLQRDQVQISSGKPFNGYLALGPSVRFGNRIQIAADLQGGMFLNNPGSLSINQLGAQRATYRFDGASKNFYPGFSGAINIVYPISTSTHFFIGTDYLQSKSSIRLVDLNRGIDIPTEQTRNVKLFTAGIGITKSFGTKREAGSGMASGKRSIDQSARDVATGQASGKRVLPTVNKREIAIDEPGVHRTISSNDVATGKTYQPGQPKFGNRTTNDNCGPVTIKNTYPDGTTEEKIFACPEDAAAFIVNTHATPGTDVSRTYVIPHVLEQNGIIHRDVATRNILAGRITWTSSPPDNGIITNKSSAVSSVSNLGGGASSAAYARNGVATGAGAAAGAASLTKGIVANIYAREASSGMATGKRTREAGSGMATGRRQYEPVFFDGGGTTCTNCIATIKSNPLYKENGNSGTNPLYQGNNKMTGGEDDDCDGVSGLSVYLIDINTNAVVAKTQTENCGDFWFANIPSGDYVVNITGGFMAKKGYEAYMSKKADLAGEILTAEEYWTVNIITDTGSVQDAQAIIKTKTKSNQSNDRLVNTSRSNIKNLAAGIGDLDGDGSADILVGSVVNSFGEKVNQGLHSAGGALSQGASLLGGSLPGGAVISAALSPGNPIGGLTIKGGKNPGGNLKTTQTNEFGEFEFTGWEEGNYTISAEIKYYINDKTIVSLGGVNLDEYNSVSQNSQTLKSINNINNNMPNRISMNVTVPKQTQGATFGEKVKAIGPDMEPDLITNSIAINNSHSNIKNLLASLDELEKMLNNDNGSAKTAINNSHSNIKNLRTAAIQLENTMDDMKTMEKEVAMNEVKNKMAAMNMQFLALQKSLDGVGKQYTTISNVLKTKHDTVKNSIGNIR